MGQSSDPFHINAASAERGDHVRFSILLWEEACCVYTAVSTRRLLPIENY